MCGVFVGCRGHFTLENIGVALFCLLFGATSTSALLLAPDPLLCTFLHHGWNGTTSKPTSYNTMVFDSQERLKPHVPHTIHQGGAEWEAVGLNECWRLAKYFPGDRFGAHVDARFIRSQDEHSMYTVNIYMNDGFKGLVALQPGGLLHSVSSMPTS